VAEEDLALVEAVEHKLQAQEVEEALADLVAVEVPQLVYQHVAMDQAEQALVEQNKITQWQQSVQ
jgi:hypothetical protein